MRFFFTSLFLFFFLNAYSQKRVLSFDFEQYGFNLDSNNIAHGVVIVQNITTNIVIIEQMLLSSGLTYADFEVSHLPIVLLPDQKVSIWYKTSIVKIQFEGKLEEFLNEQRKAIEMSFHLLGCIKNFSESIETDSIIDINPYQSLNPRWIRK